MENLKEQTIKTLIIDMNNIVSRIYFALNYKLEEDQVDIKKTINFIDKYIQGIVNSYGIETIYSTFDSYGENKSWRYTIKPEQGYKNDRTLNKNIPLILDYFMKNPIGINFQIPKLESDDIIALFTKQETIKKPILILSNDADMEQLVLENNGIFIYDLNTKDIKKIDGIFSLKEKLFLGDKSDSIPSILHNISPNIQFGEKTFLQIYQSCPENKDMEEHIIDSICQKLEKKDKNCAILLLKETLKSNLENNRKLIDFDCIPKEYSDVFLQNYFLMLSNEFKGKEDVGHSISK